MKKAFITLAASIAIVGVAYANVPNHSPESRNVIECLTQDPCWDMASEKAEQDRKESEIVKASSEFDSVDDAWTTFKKLGLKLANTQYETMASYVGSSATKPTDIPSTYFVIESTQIEGLYHIFKEVTLKAA